IAGSSPTAVFSQVGAAPNPNAIHADWRREAQLIEAQRADIEAKAPALRAWYASQGRRAALATAPVPNVGDVITLNMSLSGQGCAPPVLRKARVAAVSNNAIVVSDTANPIVSAFTDAEFASFAATWDTLVNPLDTQNFGTPTDLDGNGHVIIIFTKSVNEL